MKHEPCQYCNGTGKQIDHRALGKEMREKRLKAGMTLNDVAKSMDITAPYLSDLERGNRKWSTKTLTAIQKIL